MSKKAIIWLVRLVLAVVSRREFIGLESIQDSIEDTPVIVTGNHIGYFDALLILSVPFIANHPKLIVVVAEKYQKYGFFRWVVKSFDFMFIDRFKSDFSTLRKVLTRLGDNGLFLLAPEGTRSPNAALIQPRLGAAYLASKSNATIVPVGITGTEDKEMRNRLPRLKRLSIKVNIGDPFQIPELPKKNRDVFLETQTDEIMCRIGALLPPSYRGIYANHPRLRELLPQA
jgi:1-acyl-sn-glycerol-3-phosphate acyltransferase